MRARQNEPSSLGLKARPITFSGSNNRLAAAQIMAYTLGWIGHCSSLLRSRSFFTPRCLTNQSTSLFYQLILIRIYRLQQYLYRGNLNTSTCGFSWISLQVHITSSLKGSMTAARSEIRLISLSIRRFAILLLCVLDVGLAGCVLLLSQSPAFLPANLICPPTS